MEINLPIRSVNPVRLSRSLLLNKRPTSYRYPTAYSRLSGMCCSSCERSKMGLAGMDQFNVTFGTGPGGTSGSFGTTPQPQPISSNTFLLIGAGILILMMAGKKS